MGRLLRTRSIELARNERPILSKRRVAPRVEGRTLFMQLSDPHSGAAREHEAAIRPFVGPLRLVDRYRRPLPRACVPVAEGGPERRRGKISRGFVALSLLQECAVRP